MRRSGVRFPSRALPGGISEASLAQRTHTALLGSVQRTSRRPGTAPDDLAGLLGSWRVSLRAQNRAPRTIDGYLGAAEKFYDFLVVAGMPTSATAICREHVEAHLAAMADGGAGASTVATRYRYLQQLFRWL